MVANQPKHIQQKYIFILLLYANDKFGQTCSKDRFASPNIDPIIGVCLSSLHSAALLLFATYIKSIMLFWPVSAEIISATFP